MNLNALKYPYMDPELQELIANRYKEQSEN